MLQGGIVRLLRHGIVPLPLGANLLIEAAILLTVIVVERLLPVTVATALELTAISLPCVVAASNEPVAAAIVVPPGGGTGRIAAAFVAAEAVAVEEIVIDGHTAILPVGPPTPSTVPVSIATAIATTVTTAVTTAIATEKAA